MRLEPGAGEEDTVTMSHHSDEGSVMPGSESFWEPGNYKRTTKRIDDGERLCKDLILLVQERANIEKEFAKQLKSWSSKWNSLIEKGPEYGTTEAAWKAVLNEADRRSEAHVRVRDNLNNEVITSIKNWQKDNFHKQLMQIKEKKELEEQFKRAQKPWVKLLEKCDKAKSNYHLACKNEKSAVNQERNATKDSSLSQDAVRKLQDKVSKSQDNVKKCREQYEIAVSDITNYNSRYQEDMTDVFDRCQRKEAQRLQTFKDTLFQIHKCLNISEDPTLPQIYEEFYHTVSNADHEKDLRWWSNTYGVNMPMSWPQFEEYNTKPVKKSEMNGDSKTGANSTSNNHRDQPDSNGVKDANPFDDESEEWDDAGYELTDDGKAGEPVKALYDYEAAEPDELSFKTGDEFEKLEDEDEQGWCKGRKDGRVGLYPANYVEAA